MNIFKELNVIFTYKFKLILIMKNISLLFIVKVSYVY